MHQPALLHNLQGTTYVFGLAFGPFLLYERRLFSGGRHICLVWLTLPVRVAGPLMPTCRRKAPGMTLMSRPAMCISYTQAAFSDH